MVSETLVIEVVSDVICPWCYVGKRRLEKALAILRDEFSARIRWLPFELNPAMPRQGMDRGEYRKAKFGSEARSQALEGHVAGEGLKEGLAFAFDRMKRVPNTFDAHRLIWLADEAGCQDAVVEALFRAYFLEAEDVGDPAVLSRIAAENGIPPEFVEGCAAVAQVRLAEQQAYDSGITGVPYFRANGRPVASGALEGAALADALRRAVRGEQMRRLLTLA